MSAFQPFSCYLFGEGSLPIQCAQILLQKGHKLLGVISRDEALLHWSRANAIACCNSLSGALAFVQQQPADYLFSANNPLILSAELLATARKAAINYHDAPLPRYAGNYATSWALLRGEQSHAVTWHLMADRVDAGDIMKQQIIRVAYDETALSLNLKCYHAAIASFSEMVDALALGRARFTAQDLSQRTFFGLYKRPEAAAVLDWQQPAAALDALVRALTFGPYPNPLGAPKLLLPGDFAVVESLQLLPEEALLPPGSLVRVEEDTIVLATGSQNVAVHRLLSPAGEPLAPATAVARYHLAAGARLPLLAAEEARQVTGLYNRFSRQESHLVAKLAQLPPSPLPYPLRARDGDTAPEMVGLPITLPELPPVDSRAGFVPAAFVAFLARLAGSGEPFSVGFTDAGQSEASAWPSLFATMLPLDFDISLSWTIEQISAAVAGQIEKARQIEGYCRDLACRYPGLKQVPELAPGYRWPVTIAFSPAAAAPEGNPSIVTLAVDPGRGDCALHYDATALLAGYALSFRHHFVTFLQALAATPAAPISDLPLLNAADREQVLHAWNRTSVTFPPAGADAGVHRLFEQQVQLAPDTPAVIVPAAPGTAAPDVCLSYAELNRRANQLAHYLAGLGVGPGTPVGLCLDRSEKVVVAMLAVLKAGAFYLPLDPAYPPERLAYMLADSRPAVLVTESGCTAGLNLAALRVVHLEHDRARIEQESNETLQIEAGGENPAYLLYTSGSTGRPKGVLVPHRALANHSLALGESYELRPSDRVLQFASISFDVAAEEIFTTLLSGAAVVPRSEAMLASFTAFHHFVNRAGITVLNLPAPYWHEWVNALDNEPGLALPEALRLLIVGSDQVSPRHVATWRRLAGDRLRWLNAYGPTEATITCAVYDPEQAADNAAAAVPIGRPIANIQLYLLDRHLAPVPLGVPGEIYVGGAGIALGYWNQPALTAEKFIPDPFSGRPGARLYRTGDLARYLPDGNVDFLGRVDEQVKLRGFRVELAEIEAALKRHPEVDECIVVLWENELLVAYVVPGPRHKPEPRELRDFVAAIVPAYMAPAAYVFLDTLPITVNGKVNRQALPAPDLSRSRLANAYVPPQTSLEQILAEIWSAVLGIQEVGIHDNFFDLGGHSLQALQLVSRVTAQLGHELSIRTVFTSPTIEQLAQRLEAQPGLKAGNGNNHPLPELAAFPPAESRFRSTPLLRYVQEPWHSREEEVRIDAAALYYLEDRSSAYDRLLLGASQGRPLLFEITESPWGRLGTILLPRFIPELYSDPDGLLAELVEAVLLAGRLGARAVSLTGMIPSATRYGRALQAALAGEAARPADLPAVTTGHATTTAAVALTIERILAESGRDLRLERAGFLGLGAIGAASLRLMLNCLPHPAEIYLADLYSKQYDLERLRQEIVGHLGFQGAVHILEANNETPRSFYDASLIIGATNVANILDVDRLQPGTLIVDDSGPHCFDPQQAIQRLQSRSDILFTEGGVLRLRQAVRRTRFVPELLDRLPASEPLKTFTIDDPYEMMGCTLSSLLSHCWPELKPTVGLIDVDTSLLHHRALIELGIRAGHLHCEGYRLQRREILVFRERFSEVRGTPVNVGNK
jgi:amino acid adenylation domain-containing protein